MVPINSMISIPRSRTVNNTLSPGPRDGIRMLNLPVNLNLRGGRGGGEGPGGGGGGGGVGARRVHIKSGSQRVQREGATEWLPFPIT